MIDPALLDRLQKADPDTWNRFVDTELFTYNEYDDYGKTERYAYQEDLIEAAREAWLQHVLQEAIRTQKWHLLQSQDPSTRVYYVEISKIAPGYAGDHYTEHCLWLIGSGEDNSPADALLKAYLEAIV